MSDEQTVGYDGYPKFDWYLGQVVQALIEDGKEDIASLLIPARMSFTFNFQRTDKQQPLEVTLHCPYTSIRELRKPRTDKQTGEDYAYFDVVKMLFELVFAPRLIVDDWHLSVEGAPLPESWRTELLEAIRKRGTTNQGRAIQSSERPITEYAGLRFRSATEVKIAKVLDSKGVLYFANCTARLNLPGDRLNREPDFLVCHDGKWGILEVDGDPFHPPSRASQEHERDRLFKKHGVHYIERYNATRCYEEPLQVVLEFLDLLAKS